MRLGIDLGTTRIVAAAVDRGNYPVVTFEDGDGTSWEWFPPLIAARGSERLYGWDAWRVQAEPGYTIIRSIKRILEDAGPATLVQLGDASLPVHQILEEMMRALKTALLEKSSLNAKPGVALEVMLGVPANANSNQRFLTVDPVQRAGFSVLGLLNEPSAASIEYGHRKRGTGADERVLIYDLGGGTFDVSLVDIEGREHSVIASEGISMLGGDDFDILLADLTLEAAGIKADLTQAEIFRLHEECRTKKEALHPNTKRITIDLGSVREGWDDVSIPVDVFYASCRPLITQTIEASEKLLNAQRVDAVYITGGGSELPLVSRMLKEVFGRRVHRSAYTRSGTAIGLAIQADTQAGYKLRERFTRHFGVWREGQSGREVLFDILFAKGTMLPGAGEAAIELKRSYVPVHNVGHFRYLECSQVGEAGRPVGDIAVWDEIRFPFDASLHTAENLAGIAVNQTAVEVLEPVEEVYSCDANGSVGVTIRNTGSGYERTYRLGRWSQGGDSVMPGKKRKKR
ncbi:MAG: Hsp70 family protein [Bryobacteraceae bacterium]